MKCVSPVNRLIDGRWVTVPCRQCYACRVNHTSEWAFRNALEVSTTDKAAFITLTYDDDSLNSPSLVYKDLQNFWKNLRPRYDNKIRYYACGEYGSISNRPHFHAIVYGIGTEKIDRENVYQSWKRCDPVRILYGKGVAPVTIDDIRYVSGYTEKKLTGKLGREEYQNKGLLPPRSFCSRNPPIGAEAFLYNLDNIREYGCIFWNGQQIPIPEYFRRKYADLLYNSELEKDRLRHKLDKLGLNERSPQLIRAIYRGLLDVSYSEKLNEDADVRISNHLARQRLKRSRMKL